MEDGNICKPPFFPYTFSVTDTLSYFIASPLSKSFVYGLSQVVFP